MSYVCLKLLHFGPVDEGCYIIRPSQVIPLAELQDVSLKRVYCLLKAFKDLLRVMGNADREGGNTREPPTKILPPAQTAQSQTS